MASPGRITFIHLTEVPIAAVLALLTEPRNARHMPLAGTWSEKSAVAWVQGKDAQWEANGYGPWAILFDGGFAGWGGFQREENGADFALVLLPTHWGSGGEIARGLLNRGFDEFGFDEVLIALPFTQTATRALARFGFVPHGDVTYGGAAFRQYRLARDAWGEAHSSR